MSKRNRAPRGSRFGIGEWFGYLFAEFDMEQRRGYINAVKGIAERPPCPFKSAVNGLPQPCTKPDGVCSVQLYVRESKQPVMRAAGDEGKLRCTCPSRFHEDGIVQRWIEQELMSDGAEADGACEVIYQAVDFTGPDISEDFSVYIYSFLEGIPLPTKVRWPNYPASGPGHLLPLLQAKAPGQKLAVVVDESFFAALGEMRGAPDPSKADIVWFVVGFEDDNALARLVPRFVRFTSFEQAVAALTTVKEVELELAPAPLPLDCAE